VPGLVDFESEWAYLDRLDLLLPEERTALEVEDDPEPPDLDDPQWGWLARRDLQRRERPTGDEGEPDACTPGHTHEEN
jgi:hypothetical protein